MEHFTTPAVDAAGTADSREVTVQAAVILFYLVGLRALRLID